MPNDVIGAAEAVGQPRRGIIEADAAVVAYNPDRTHRDAQPTHLAIAGHNWHGDWNYNVYPT